MIFLIYYQHLITYVYKKFNEFRLIFYLIYVGCQQEENFHFSFGDLFNIEGDLILFEVD